MTEEAVFTPTQAEILSIVEKTPGLSINEIGRRAGISAGAAFARVDKLKSRHLLTTRKVGKERRVYLKDDCPEEETEQVLLPKTRARLARKFTLDELELKILLEAESETAQEVAKELKVLLMLVDARIERSIPSKLKMRLREARRMIKKELAVR